MATWLAVLGVFRLGHFLQENLDNVTLYRCSRGPPEVTFRPQRQGSLGSRAHNSWVYGGSFPPVSRHIDGKVAFATASHRNRMQLRCAFGPSRETQGGMFVLRLVVEKGRHPSSGQWHAFFVRLAPGCASRLSSAI